MRTASATTRSATGDELLAERLEVLRVGQALTGGVELGEQGGQAARAGAARGVHVLGVEAGLNEGVDEAVDRCGLAAFRPTGSGWAVIVRGHGCVVPLLTLLHCLAKAATAAWSRDLTVPSGISSSSAIWA